MDEAEALAKLKTSLAYKLVVLGMAVSSANYIMERLDLSPRPITPKEVTGYFIPSAGMELASSFASTSLWTSNYSFSFNGGSLFCVMNEKTNIEAGEHFRAWAKMPSLVNSNSAYCLATQWLSRVFVDIPTLTQKYVVTVGQPIFYGDEGTNKDYPASWGHVGTNKVTLPLYYVTWTDPAHEHEAAKVGIFGPTKQLMGLTIRDETLSKRKYITVTNKKELMDMTDVPPRLMATNAGLYKLFVPKVPLSNKEAR